MPPINILIKPASSGCNLRCKYCFYHSVSQLREVENYGVMSKETLEIIVKKALAYSDGFASFAFQGGEPTLAGLPFYEKLMELEKKYNVKNVQIHNAIQTNGMVIDEDWARFFHKNNFLVGLSLDGPQNIHDENRVMAGGKGSFDRVMHTAELFNKYRVEYNILTVVSKWVAQHARIVYQFFRKNKFQYLQFIPCLDPVDETPFQNDFSLTPGDYLQFLKTTFDLWYCDFATGKPVSIRYFDNLVTMAMGYPPESCGMSGVCTCYFVAEADGSIYPCDFYVTDKWYLGNVHDTNFEDLLASPAAKEFMESSRHVDEKCKSCDVYTLCRGGFRRNREPFADGKPALNNYCDVFYAFFKYAGENIQKMADKLR